MWPRFAPDERLVALVRRGELTAFEILYDRHARELLAFCSYMLDSRHDAEDAVQSTFASACAVPATAGPVSGALSAGLMDDPVSPTGAAP